MIEPWVEIVITEKPVKEVMRTMRVELPGLTGYYMEVLRYHAHKTRDSWGEHLHEEWEVISHRVFVPDNKL